MSTDRRTAFRELIRRLDSAEQPHKAMEQRFYVEPDGSISERLANRLELAPTSTHMLVGGIGSGKTTQLLRVKERLEAVSDVRAFFVDVLERQRLDRLDKPGTLLALAGLELRNTLSSSAGPVSKNIAAAQRQITRSANGYMRDPFDDAPAPPDDVWTPDIFEWAPGIIEPPEEQTALKRLEQAIQTISSALPFRPVLLFDGLDRLKDVSMFVELVSTDVPVLKRAGVGVVVVAPQHARTSQRGAAQDSFDELHLHGAAHIGGEEGLAFLQNVLLTRAAGTNLLPEAMCTRIARLSGGIVRDLLALARASAEEAYRLGADAVEEDHVKAAADHFGRNLLVGIDQEMVVSLQKLAPKQQTNRWYAPVSFTVATETDVMLLLRRLIIEIPTTPVEYIFHPTIIPLIAGLKRRA